MTAAFGADAVFKAGNSIRAAQVFPPILREQAASCPVMLVCIGPRWLTAGAPGAGRALDRPDDWVRREIAISLLAGNYVIPLLFGNHDEVSIPPADQVPQDIRPMAYRQAWRLAPGGGLDLTVPELIARLAELVPELDERRTMVGPGSGNAKPPAAAEQDSVRDAYVQENTASGNGTVIAVQHGTQHNHAPSARDPRSGRAAPPEPDESAH